MSEYERLDSKWIDENKVARINNLRKMTTDDVVPVGKLQNLLVPKQELPVIPQFVADWIEKAKRYHSISWLLNYENIKDWSNELALWCFESGNDDNLHKLARAWLDGYTIKKEQKYVIKISEHDYMVMDDEGFMYPTDINVHKYKSEFTEQEIKDYDKRFWVFRKPVEEIEE